MFCDEVIVYVTVQLKIFFDFSWKYVGITGDAMYHNLFYMLHII